MKKLLAILASMAFLLPASASATTYPVGDANCSGTVTMADANLVFAIYLEKPGAETGPCDPRIDINCSGTVTPADVLLIQLIYLEKPVNYPATCTCP